MSTLKDGKRTKRIGTRMPDGSIYAGISPDTRRPMYTTPKDATRSSCFWFPKQTFSLRQAFTRASAMDAHGRQDWRLPTESELNVLFRNRAAIGGFNTMGMGPAGWYWSSSHTAFYAWARRFSDGFQDYYYGSDVSSSLRCVRG